MSYLVLGLGVFLSLAGAIAFYTGYGIIEVERGWASVIAGSVAFSCGIVTVALGLILHRLARLPAFLNVGQGVTPRLGDLAWRPDDEPPSDIPSELSFGPQSGAVPPVAVAPIPSPRSWAKRPIRSNLTAARSFLKPRGHVPPPARGLPAAEYSTLIAPPFSHGDLNQAGPEPALEPEFVIPPEVAMNEAGTETEAWASFTPLDKPDLFGTAPNEKIAASSFEEPFPEIQEKLGRPQVQSEPGTSWPSKTVAIETIFEEELFIELHRKPEKRGGEPASSATMPPQQPPPNAPQSITSGGQEELAIVGQYQSAGTSYIMYSNGSIEARTEHAVFHFKSMTELKAFMDSEARTSKE